jgi:hypothetical protein
MTAAELKAIDQLGNRFDDFREDNKAGHQDIKDYIKGVETRLTKKVDEDIAPITSHCKDRQLEVDAILARGLVSTDAHIAAAKVEAIAESTPKPSVYMLASKGAMDGLIRFASRAAIIVALLAALVALIDKLGLM